MRRSVLSWWMCLVVLLAGCTIDSRKSTQREPIIPETTKVTDADTRAVLSSFDRSSGVMRFDRMTPVLENLRPGDVLVSEPSPAAPDGYLRGITSIRREGDAVLVESTQGNLTDAIHRGSLDAFAELQPDDLGSATSHVNGLEVGVRPNDAIDVGDGYKFQASFDETVLELDDGDVKIKVRVDGNLYFNAGYNIGIGIDNINLEEGRPLPEVDRFEAWVGFDQLARLHISGEANAKVSKEEKVADYRFKPVCFAIAFVPVCVVPTVYLFVGASGEVNLKFDYGVTQTAQARIGAKWLESSGWSKIEPTPHLSGSFDQNLEVHAALNVNAHAKTEAALMLYGVAGPLIGARLGAELDVAVPRNPLWILRGHLDTYYSFIVDLPVIGRVAESSDDIYSVQVELGRSPNQPPSVTGVTANGYGFFGQSYELRCNASDPEDGVPEVTWTSSIAGELGKGATLLASLTFGQHVITARARDSGGLTAEQSVTVSVDNKPPRVSIDKPAAGASYYAGQTAFLAAYTYDPESGTPLADASVTWSSSLHGYLATGNTTAAALLPAGTHTLTVTGVDRDGESASASIELLVMPPPPDGNPPTAAMYVDYDPYTSTGVVPLTLVGNAVDTEDGTLTGNSLAWTFESLSNGITCDFSPVAHGTIVNTVLRGVGRFRITLTATDSSGKAAYATYEGETHALH